MAISAEIASPTATPSWKWIEVIRPSHAALQTAADASVQPLTTAGVGLHFGPISHGRRMTRGCVLPGRCRRGDPMAESLRVWQALRGALNSPPMVRSVLLRQQLALKEDFRRRYPHWWLVWEEGAWNVSGPGEQSLSRTMPPRDELEDCLPTGDVLAFELDVSDGRQIFKLGRSAQNDIVIDDSTVSREHLALRCSSPNDWLAETKGPGRRLFISGKRVAHGTPVPLRPGDTVKVGSVVLTLYDPDLFDRRLQSEAQKLLAKAPRR